LSCVPGIQQLLYRVADPKTGFDLWALPLVGEPKPMPVAQSPFNESEGQFSPDGRWVAYTSNETGRVEVYVRSFSQQSGKWPVSPSGGSQVRWRRDGRELFFVASDGVLMAASVSADLKSGTIEIGKAVPLFTPTLATGANVTGAKPQYAVGPDGRFLINIAVNYEAPTPITVVVNWRASVRK
jgi:hypothetical protein